MPQPTIQTARLTLRPFALADAPDVQRFAGAREVARMVSGVPHPYEDGMAEEWIATHADNFALGKAAHFAVTLRETGEFCGVVGLQMREASDMGTLGYWFGVPFWGRGYCTEAARAVVDFGFESLGLRRIRCDHSGSNPASGRVMQKLGMRREGCQREQFLKWGVAQDLVMYGLLRREWKASRPSERQRLVAPEMSSLP